MFEPQIKRAKNLILTPKAEWEVIDGESVDVAALYKSWIMPLAAIPAVAGFIGTSILGVGGFGFHYRVPFFSGLFNALLSFVIALAGVFVFAHIISALAPYFGAQKNFNQAFKVSAYTSVAAWLSGVFLVIPALSILALIGGLYSLYLLFVGLPVLMSPKEDKSVPYTLVVILGSIVLSLVLGLIIQAMMPHPMSGSHRQSKNEKILEHRSEAMEKAAKSGDLSGMLAAISGGSAKVISDLDALKKLAPAKLGGLKRVELRVENRDAPIKAGTLKAVYEGSGDRTMTLNIMNSPGVNFLKAMAGMTGAMRSVKKENGSFESLSQKKDSLVMQKWDAASGKGTYAWSYKNFIVSVKGQDVPLKTLEKAATTVSHADLDRLPKG